jgi:hypothetical protein
VNLENVSSVYSGKRNRCCCGCAGKHTYSSVHQEWSGENRGYSVSNDEVNDRTVKLIYNKVMNKLTPGTTYAKIADGCYTAETDTRLYIVYFKE